MVNETSTKHKKIKKVPPKKKHIKYNRLLTSLSIFLLLTFFLGGIIKTIYINSKCTDLFYAVDYHFTNYYNKSLRLIKVDSISILSNEDNIVEIEASGFSYKKPYGKTSLIGTFIKSETGKWTIDTIVPKYDD